MSSGLIIKQIQSDTHNILSTGGFERLITLTPPSGSAVDVYGLCPVHHVQFDEDGRQINGKNAHITISETSLKDVEYTYLNSSKEVAMQGHLVSFENAVGDEKTYIVRECYYDEMIGLISLILGKYDAS